MNRCVLRTAVLFLATALFATGVMAQSLTDKLKQEDNFYINYGKETYAKLKIEKDVVGLYDFFGEHIVDGVKLYELSYQNSILNNEREGITDSMKYSQSLEKQRRDFYEKFSNVVVTQDAIGGIKTSFLIGDQITTRFTPLTMNMVDFKGIRWDLWSSGLQFSVVLNRTRPGFTSKKITDGSAMVEYPITSNSFPSSTYNRGIRGDWDGTSKSPYGDYDFLWAIHAQNNIANAVDIGLTYINHHVNDVKRGPQPFAGQLPDSLIPTHIHFEFYDATPEDTTDAGVYVDNLTMYINDREVEARDVYRDVYKRVFVGDRDGVLLPRDIPMARAQSGQIPVIAEFKIDPRYWRYKKATAAARDEGEFELNKIKKIKFTYGVAGNYMVFVSTDRQNPTSIYGVYNPQKQRVDYSYPTKSVGDIYDDVLKINASGNPNKFSNPDYYSATYFGEYIAQCPRKTRMTLYEFDQAIAAANNSIRAEQFNYKSYTWNYNLNVSSITYGLNFKGEIAGVKFSGEFNVNQSEDMLPGSDSSRMSSYKLAGNLKAEREIGKSFGLSGEAYYISPQWMTNLDILQTSQYFNQTSYKEGFRYNGTGASATLYPNDPDYMVAGARPLNNEWRNIDDNDDNDNFPENNRRRYPSDLDANEWGDLSKFNDDGSLKAPLLSAGSSYNKVLHQVTLPNGMDVTYDDPDGVVASKNDKNKNGEPDFIEDFLLFGSDPPVFELGQDLNNNGLPDYEDDDLLPDFGHAVGYVIAGDGIKTQGIQGFSLNLRWAAFENGAIDIGGVVERVPDRNLMATEDGGAKDITDDDMMDGRSYVGYATIRQEVLRRSQGMQYDWGLELRYVRDAIRNDAIRTNFTAYEQDYNVTYGYYLDPMSYRNAAVGNLVGSLTYNNIRNFEYGIRGHAGVEKQFLVTTTAGDSMLFYAPRYFDRQWKPYPDRLIGQIDFVNRVQYRFRFNNEFEDWRSIFNFVNRLEIMPQYKIGYTSRKEFQGPDETQVDPRDIRKDLSLDYDQNGEIDPILDNVGTNLDSVAAVSTRWSTYTANNYSYVMSVPIIRANFKVAENTQLQFGSQWLRYYDIVSPENSVRKFTFLGQIVSKANYKGYNVTFFLGGRWYNIKPDITARDAALGNGFPFDIRGYEFFAKLYSGI